MVKDSEAWHPEGHGVAKKLHRHSPSRIRDGTLGVGRCSVQPEFISLISAEPSGWIPGAPAKGPTQNLRFGWGRALALAESGPASGNQRDGGGELLRT